MSGSGEEGGLRQESGVGEGRAVQGTEVRQECEVFHGCSKTLV